MKRKHAEAAPLEQTPIEFEHQPEALDSSIINKIGKKLDTSYWSCANGAAFGVSCGCEDGSDDYGAGGTQSNPIWFDRHKNHWCKPTRVDDKGRTLDPDAYPFPFALLETRAKG